MAGGYGRVSSNQFSVSDWIVDGTGIQNGATHTTIQGAIDDASSSDTIFIKPGTYTENITLPASVTIWAADNSNLTSSVVIQGKITQTATGNSSVSNIRIQTNGDVCVDIGGSGTIQTQFYNCTFVMSDGDCLTVNNASASPYFKNCNFIQSGDTLDYWNITTCGTVAFDKCRFSVSGAVGTSNIAAGVVAIRYCRFANQHNLTTQTTGNIQADFSHFISGSNITWITTAGTNSNNEIRNCYFNSGSSAAISIGTGTLILATGLTIESTNANPITGSGTLITEGALFSGSGSGINTTTWTEGSARFRALNLKNPLVVENGGIGTTTLTDGGPLLGSGTGAITALGQPTDGQLVIGSTGVDPVLASLTAPVSGLTITGGAGTITFALTDGLAALEALASTGIVAHTGADTYSERTITGTANEVDISNGDGVSGNPTVGLVASPHVTSISFDSGTNFLSNYSSGSWTPALTGSGSNPSVTYTTQLGKYTRIGNVVHIKCTIVVNTYSGGTGNLQITGLPFISSNDAMTQYGTIRTDGMNWDGAEAIVSQISANSNIMFISGYSDNAGGATIDTDDVAAGDSIRIVMTYWV